MDQFLNKLSANVFQTNDLRNEIILKILNSKRLLSDHVEIVELTLNDLKTNENPEWINIPRSVVVIAASVLTFHISKTAWPRIVMASLTGGCLSIAGIQNISRLNNHFTLNKVQKMINVIDRFESYIKRNLVLFNEKDWLNVDTNLSSSREQERERLFINGIKSIAIELSTHLSEIEEKYPLPPIYDEIYERWEDITNCDYFKQSYNENKIVAKDAKAFYNIFAYVQSQFLMRFSLTVAYHELDRNLLNRFTKIYTHIALELTNQEIFFKKLTRSVVEHHVPPPDNKLNHTSCDDLLLSIKKSSLILSSKLILMANLYQAFEEDLQNGNDADSYKNLADRLQTVDTYMTTCHDELKHSALALNKFMNEKFNIPLKLDVLRCTDSSDENTMVSGRGKIVSEFDEPTQMDDDFFALDMTQVNNDADRRQPLIDYDDEDMKLNSKIVKSYFKPVLVQLREKIDPIHKQMRNKEREVLAKKGINVDEMEEKLVSVDSDDDGSGDDEWPARKKRSSSNKYEESRKLLMSKEQPNLIPFRMPILPPMAVDGNFAEDILE